MEEKWNGMMFEVNVKNCDGGGMEWKKRNTAQVWDSDFLPTFSLKLNYCRAIEFYLTPNGARRRPI